MFHRSQIIHGLPPLSRTARYSLFVLKVLLNTSQPTNHPPLSAAVLSYPSVPSAALSVNMLYTYGQLLFARVTPC